MQIRTVLPLRDDPRGRPHPAPGRDPAVRARSGARSPTNPYPRSSNTCRTGSPTGPRPATGSATPGTRATATPPCGSTCAGTATARACRATSTRATELADGVAVVNWLAEQPWCDGKVGMFGISWGGFNSLQIAALAPEPLKAVVTVCSTDDRYDNDVHYMGGSVLAVDMHAWAATMLAFVSRPPDPHVRRRGWRDMWLKRLEAVDPFIHTWLDHQTRDAYWRHGSVCEDYARDRRGRPRGGRLARPVPRHGAAARRALPADRVRGLIGPWSHQYPDRGPAAGPGDRLPPGDPALVGPVAEGPADTGVMDEPLLRSWISDSHPPATVYDTLPGPLGRRPRPGRPRNVTPVDVRPPGRARARPLPAAHRAGRGPLLPLRERRRPAAGPAGRGREVGVLRVRGRARRRGSWGGRG